MRAVEDKLVEEVWKSSQRKEQIQKENAIKKLRDVQVLNNQYRHDRSSKNKVADIWLPYTSLDNEVETLRKNDKCLQNTSSGFFFPEEYPENCFW